MNFRRNRCFSNVPKLTRLGFSMLKRSRFTVVPSDKDGCMVLLEEDTLREVHREILDSHFYVLDGGQEPQIFRRVASLAKQIAELEEDESLFALIMRPLHDGGQLHSRSIVNCKTHKPPTQVAFRNIHASVQFCLVGLSRWTMIQLRGALNREGASHLIRNTAQFVSEVERVPADDGHHFVRCDISDFYMSGHWEELIPDILGASFTGRRRQILFDTLRLLLCEQIVVSQFFLGARWRVVSGTGQGLPHSGDMADIAMWHCAEQGWGVCPEIMLRFQIVKYWRFKDDILFIANHWQLKME